MLQTVAEPVTQPVADLQEITIPLFQSTFVTRWNRSTRCLVMTTHIDNISLGTKFDWERALNACPDLTPTQHHVAVTLSGLLKKEGYGFVTHEKLAAATKLSKRTICYSLRALEEAGWVERIKGTRGRATTYQIAAPSNLTTGTAAQPVEAETAPKKKTMVDPAHTERARSFIRRALVDTNRSGDEVDTDSHTARRLISIIRRQFSSNAGDQDSLMRLYFCMTETSLETAADPAAVLIHRYGVALRRYPHLKPCRPHEFERSTAVDDMLKELAAKMSSPEVASRALS